MYPPILYTLPNCPGCGAIKAALARRPDVAQQIEQRDARATDVAQQMVELGSRKVPTLAVWRGDRYVAVTDPNAILQQLGLR